MTSLDIWMSGNHFKDMVHPIIQFLFIYLDYFGASSSSGFNVIFLKKNYFSCFRLTLHTSASWIRFLSDCSRKLKAYSWVLASTITSLACFTSICVAQHKCHPSKHLYYYKSLLCILLSLKKKKSHLHLSEPLPHGLILSLHFYHLLPQPLQLIVQLCVCSQQVLVVHQQAAHLKPSQTV